MYCNDHLFDKLNMYIVGAELAKLFDQNMSFFHSVHSNNILEVKISNIWENCNVCNKFPSPMLVSVHQSLNWFNETPSHDMLV